MELILCISILLVAALAVTLCVRRISALNSQLRQSSEANSQLNAHNLSLEAQLKTQEEVYKAKEALQAKLDAEKQAASARMEQERAEAQSRLEQEKREAQEKLERERAEAQERIEQERKTAFESLSKQMEESFKLLSSQNSSELSKRNSESIAELLKPVAQKFEQYDKSMRESQDKALAQDASMRELIGNLLERTNSVGDEAKNLANALSGKSKVQGDFGEMLLVDLLKASGMEEGTHFRAQSVLRDDQGHEIKSDSGATMIPDVLVYYPDGSEVVIDSKVSLSAYLAYSAATTIEDRKKWAKEHVRSISRHIEELRSKDYASYISEGKKKIEYNIMFIPIEGAFRLMLEEEPLLWNEAKQNKVLIVSQMNLAIVLNTILLGWRRYDQQRNIQEVFQTAQELMSQLQNWMEAFVKVGDCLQKADTAYSDARKKLTESNQSVVRKIAKLERLNIAPKRSGGKLKISSRSAAGFESIIPAALTAGTSVESEIESSDQ